MTTANLSAVLIRWAEMASDFFYDLHAAPPCYGLRNDLFPIVPCALIRLYSVCQHFHHTYIVGCRGIAQQGDLVPVLWR